MVNQPVFQQISRLKPAPAACILKLLPPAEPMVDGRLTDSVKSLSSESSDNQLIRLPYSCNLIGSKIDRKCKFN